MSPRSIAFGLGVPVHSRKPRLSEIHISPRQVIRTSYPKSALALPTLPSLLCATVLASHPLIPTRFRGPPTAFIISAFFSNASLLCSSDPLLSMIIQYAPSAIALLLLYPASPNVSLQSSTNAPLLQSFLLGAFATLLGAFVSALLPLPISPSLRLALSAAFCATYVGGSLNFVAVLNLLKIPSPVAAAAFAADMSLMAIYFSALFWLAARISSPPKSPRSVTPREKISLLPENAFLVFFPVAITVILYFVANVLARLSQIPPAFDLMIFSLLAILTSFMRPLRPMLKFAPQLGELAITFFFATLGASTNLRAMLTSSCSVVIIALVVLGIHALIMWGVGYKILRLPGRELLVASNANVGGPATAAAFAAAAQWGGIVAGGVLVGTVGYVIGTPLGMVLWWCMYKLISPMP